MSKTKYILVLIFFTAFVFESCKKRHADEVREPFTDEQMEWINNFENPKYKRVLKVTDSTGDTIIKVDTMISHTRKIVNKNDDVIEDEYIISHYTGFYEFQLGSGYDYDLNLGFYSKINISNYYNFIVRLLDDYNGLEILKITPDTAMINGKLYTDVYKLENCQSTFRYIYFKRGIGFLYMQKVNGNNITLIENTAKAVRVKENKKEQFYNNIGKSASSNGGV